MYAVIFSCDEHPNLVDLLRLLAHHLEELLKVDGAVAVDVELDDQVEDLVLGGVLSDGAQHGQQLLGRDSAAAVLKKRESYVTSV